MIALAVAVSQFCAAHKLGLELSPEDDDTLAG